MKELNSRTTLFLLASLTVLSLCGCDSFVRPSNDARHASYQKIQSLFTADAAALRQTYLVFSGNSQFTMSAPDPKTGNFALDSARNKELTRGLAIGMDADGYLLTAGHVVQSNNFVMGWFDGAVGLRSARVVFRNDFNYPSDVALLKVEGKLDHCATFGEKPKVGDHVFAVAGYYKNKDVANVAIGFAGGTVTSVRNGPSGSSVTLIRSDIPLWHGDSGGPLLSSTGRLIGVFTEFDWRGVYRTTFFLPDKEFIQNLIAQDRTAGKSVKQSLQATATATSN